MIPAAGHSFRQFHILERVGGGGMGEVFRARDTKLGREVALKFLTRLGRVTPEHAERLRREARSLAALSHPNVVTIYDFDEIDGLPYLVLEWVAGSDLTRALAPPLSQRQFLDLALPIADALAAAHRQGMVHRDIKPANVLLGEDGRVKLLDFGLAKLAEPEQDLTEPDTILGTYAYMSPEQALGKEAGPASDVFSFGVLAYELLSGQRPFPGERAVSVLHAIVHHRPQPLGQLRRDLSPELAACIDRCLEKEASARWRDGGMLAEQLRRLSTTSGAAMSQQLTQTHTPTSSAREQEIRFCTTADGCTVAYSVIGEGPLLVRVLGWFTHLEMEWEWPDLRFFWERLAGRFSVVRYDGRGIGLSDRYEGAFTEETRRLDLEAVLDAVGGERVALLGISEGAWTAAAYAAERPDRVRRLILYGGYSRGVAGRAGHDPEAEQALVTLVRKGWGRESPAFRGLFTADFFPGNTDAALVAHFNELQRVSADPDTAARYLASTHGRGDGSDQFTRVRTPTLVVHRRGDQVVPFEEGRRLAGLIPGAKLLALGGGSHYFPTNQPGTLELVEAIDRFAADGD